MCGKMLGVKRYLINLAEDVERLDFQVRQFRRLGLDFERVEGCRDDRSAYSAFRWWCNVLNPPAKGEVGCARSHAKIYAAMVAQNEACAAVFEDDVVFSSQIAAALELAEAVCREDPRRVVLLGDHRRTKAGEALASDADRLSVAETDWDFCTEGYVIGLEAARTLERVQRRVRVPADRWGYFRKKGWIRLSRLSPPVCGQKTAAYASTIGERPVIFGRSYPARLWWKLRRCAGVAIDAILDGGKVGW